MVKISVIIPVYNCEDFIDETLNSLLNQTFKDFEVICVDDGSNDGSRYIIDKYDVNHKNFHAFHKNNEGPGIARNFGIDHAKGEYIHFMDSDDYLVCDALEKMYYCASKYCSDVISGNFYRFDENRCWFHKIGDYVFNSLENDLYNTNLFKYPNLIWDMTMGNKIYKKQFLDDNNIRFYNEKIIFEDNIFSTEVYIKAKTVSVIKDSVYCWRLRAPNKSITQYHDIDRGEELYKMAEIVNGLLKNNIVDNEILSKKYMKLLLIDIPFYMSKVKNYSKEDSVYIFEGAYNLVQLVPDRYFNDLNNYYKVFYEVLKNKDWENLKEFFRVDLKKNPNSQVNIDKKYYDKFNFTEDAQNEELSSYTNKVYIKDDNINFKLINKILFNEKIRDNELKFTIKNSNFDDEILDCSNFKNNILSIPWDLINFGENKIIVQYQTNFKKECMLNTRLHKYFIFDDFEIIISRDKDSYLKLTKLEKNNINLTIKEIKFEGDKFKLIGMSNQKLDNILLNDYLNFNRFFYPIKYECNNEFSIIFDFKDLLKTPIKKWELKSNDAYGKIKVSKPFKFYNEKYIIEFKNKNDNINIFINRYDSIEELNLLNKNLISLKEDKKQLKKENKELKNQLKMFKSRKIVRVVDKFKNL